MLKVIPLQKNNFRGAKNADILEIWFDKISPKHYSEIFKKAGKPIIYKAEKTPKEEVVKKVQYIDVDIKTPKHTIQKIRKTNPEIKVILSYHNFKETPYERELKAVYKKMLDKKADIVKFASHAKSITDSFRMLDFLSLLAKKEQKAICLCMGKHGLLTRIGGHLFGNHMMYFAPGAERKTAPGQITIKEFNAYTHES